MLKPDAGSVRVLGGPPGSADDRVGLMPQSLGAWSAAKPREMLRYLASLYPNPAPLDPLIDVLQDELVLELLKVSASAC